MKKTLLFIVLAIAIALGVACAPKSAAAQTPQTDNAGFVGASFYTSDVVGKVGNLGYNKSTDAFGVNASYTRFIAGGAVNTIGLTADLGANFNGKNEASLVTVMGGITAQARNSKFVQPYVRALGGVARQSVRLNNVTDFSDASLSYMLGGGIDVNVAAHSRYKIRLGADYVNTGFNGSRQNGARFTTGLVF
jgi:hypothetical protein